MRPRGDVPKSGQGRQAVGGRHRPSGARQHTGVQRREQETQTMQDGAGEQQGLFGEQLDTGEIGQWDLANLVGSRIKGLTCGSHPKLLTLCVNLLGTTS